MSTTGWFIRLENQVLGPMSEAEVLELAKRGGITPQTPVSMDGVRWSIAANIPQIIFGNKPVPPSPPTVLPVHQNPSHPWTLVIGIAIGGAVVLFGGLGLLIVIGLVVGKTPSKTASSPPNAQPALTHEQIVIQKTYSYWASLKEIDARDLPKNGDAQALILALRNIVQSIRALPTADVDPDAVRLGNDLATLWSNLADVLEENNDPGKIVEAMLRGAGGDIFGPALEALDEQSAITQQIRAVQNEFANARAILSSRYGVEFPAF